jgi:hypothetical protein
MKNITQSKIYTVREWNNTKRSEGKYIMMFTLGDGSMVDEPRKRGYVVEKRHRLGGHGCKYLKNIELAREWQAIDLLTDNKKWQ